MEGTMPPLRHLILSNKTPNTRNMFWDICLYCIKMCQCDWPITKQEKIGRISREREEHCEEDRWRCQWDTEQVGHTEWDKDE